MAHILLTGGTGHLGQELVPRLLTASHSIRVMSRRAAEPGEVNGGPGLIIYVAG